MKVMLLKKLEGTGDSGSIVEVPDGYARNFLIPRRYAVLATASVLAEHSHETQKKKREQQERHKANAELAKKLNGTRVTIHSAANKAGHLYGAVHGESVARALKEQGIAVEGRMIDLPAPIEATGDYRVTVRLDGDHAGDVTVSIINRDNGKTH